MFDCAICEYSDPWDVSVKFRVDRRQSLGPEFVLLSQNTDWHSV